MSQADRKPTTSLQAIARPTFLAWEKLRPAYLVSLVVTTLVTAVLDSSAVLLGSLKFWLIVGQGAVVANLCYFVGPAVETYVNWLGWRPPWLRPVLFVLGTVLSCLLAFCVVVGLLLPDQD